MANLWLLTPVALAVAGCQTGGCDQLLASEAIPTPQVARSLEMQDRAVCLKLSVPLPLKGLSYGPPDPHFGRPGRPLVAQG